MKIAKAVSLFALHLFEGSSGISEMKDTVKALKKKMALLDAKHRNRVKCGWCKQQLTTDHFARKPAEYQSGKLLRDVLQKVGALDTQI